MVQYIGGSVIQIFNTLVQPSFHCHHFVGIIHLTLDQIRSNGYVRDLSLIPGFAVSKAIIDAYNDKAPGGKTFIEIDIVAVSGAPFPAAAMGIKKNRFFSFYGNVRIVPDIQPEGVCPLYGIDKRLLLRQHR